MTGAKNNTSSYEPFAYDAALKIIRKLRSKDYEAVLAGGCVRDFLMRKKPADFDIVTSARPEEVTKLFERTLAVGEKFGVVCVVSAGQKFEVASFRADDEYADGRHPKSIRYAGAREDALRRDFTINGMFYDPIEGAVVDYVGGQDDLVRRVVRAIGDPDKRFAEDHLRMLRAVRFAATLGFKIESFTAKAIKANAEKIGKISPERIKAELEKIFTSQRSAEGLELLDDMGLLEHILPEVAAGKGVRQGKKLHPEGDVWAHTLLSMSLLEEPSFEMAMAVLLHDVGKPPTADLGGERPFLNHERVGEEIAMKIAGRLRLSKRETAVIAFLVKHHMVLKDVRRMRKSTLKRLISHEFFDELAELHRIDALASNKDLSNYEFVMEARKNLSSEEAEPAPLVSGDDLAEIGIPPGPEMGGILKKLYTAQLDEEIKTPDEAVALARRLFEALPK